MDHLGPADYISHQWKKGEIPSLKDPKHLKTFAKKITHREKQHKCDDKEETIRTLSPCHSFDT